jgi:NAD+--asparagine ADP-ribosyltransferase
MCSDLDGKVFRVDEAVVGETYPPLHPNCRSDTTVVFNEEAAVERVYTPEDIREMRRVEEEMEDSQDLVKDLFETQMRGLESEGWKRR